VKIALTWRFAKTISTLPSIAEACCVYAAGTHFPHPCIEAAVLKAIILAQKNGARTALDID